MVTRLRAVTSQPLVVVGIGADGWPGLGEEARRALQDADVVVGGHRHLAMLPATVTARHTPWPSPLLPALDGLLDEAQGRVVVLASGDPMFHGIGRALVDRLGPERVRLLPTVSSLTLACARLGWPVEDVDVVSLVGRPTARLRRALYDGARILVLSADGGTPAEVARILREAGCGASQLTVLGDLGGDAESRQESTADDHPADGTAPRLNVVGVRVRAGSSPPPATTPGLPDDSYAHDGQLTKRHVRAVTLALLAPRPGQLLWDVGGGAGSIGIEWCRTHPRCRAVTVESHPDRAGRIEANADTLGVTGRLEVVHGRAPEALAGLPVPDAVFIGGGLTEPGLLDLCLTRLRPGGVLVANTVTLESEAVLTGARARFGGELTRLEVSAAHPVGGFTGWVPARPVSIWSVTKPGNVEGEWEQ